MNELYNVCAFMSVFLTKCDALEIHPSCWGISSIFLFVAWIVFQAWMHHSLFNHLLILMDPWAAARFLLLWIKLVYVFFVDI